MAANSAPPAWPGFTRNLDPAEIAGQVLAAEQLSGERVDNLVFMGMGEPLANLTNLLAAIALITGDQTLHLGARHLTISTSGLVPQIRQLAEHPQQIRLAISLHGATDEVREQIMPINKKWPLAELFDALDDWNSRKNQKLTFEYILIQGVNDALEQAAILARHARRLHAKVNLIPYNTVHGLDWNRPPDSHCRALPRGPHPRRRRRHPAPRKRRRHRCRLRPTPPPTGIPRGKPAGHCGRTAFLRATSLRWAMSSLLICSRTARDSALP